MRPTCAEALDVCALWTKLTERSDVDPNQDYYVTVTAHDNEGRESLYCSVEQKRCGYWIYLPLNLHDP